MSVIVLYVGAYRSMFLGGRGSLVCGARCADEVAALFKHDGPNWSHRIFYGACPWRDA